MSRKPLTTRAVTQESVVESLNREIIPYIRQTTPGTVVTGSRSIDAIAILGTVLQILEQAGIIVDDTTP